MRRLGAALLVLGGIALVLLGLLFLLGAAGRASRYLIAVIALTMGGAAVGLGLRLFRQAASAAPEQLRAEILELARRQSGELAQPEIEATLGRRAGGAAAVLTQLEAEGVCRELAREGTRYWLFPALQPRLLVRRCEYCQAELPVNEAVASCPICGGTIKTGVERRSLAEGDAYRMDE